MPGRSDLILQPSMAAGLIAAGPWVILLASTLIAGIVSTPLLLALTPAGLAGAIIKVRRCGLLRSPRSVVRLVISGARLRAKLGDGREYTVRVSGDSRLTASLALLKISPCDTTLTSELPPTTVILLGGAGWFSNTRSQPFREFRVWLRLNRSSPEAA